MGTKKNLYIFTVLPMGLNGWLAFLPSILNHRQVREVYTWPHFQVCSRLSRSLGPSQHWQVGPPQGPSEAARGKGRACSFSSCSRVHVFPNGQPKPLSRRCGRASHWSQGRLLGSRMFSSSHYLVECAASSLVPSKLSCTDKSPGDLGNADSDSVSYIEARDSAFLASFLVMLMLLVGGPQFENHGPKASRLLINHYCCCLPVFNIWRPFLLVIRASVICTDYCFPKKHFLLCPDKQLISY